MGQMDSPKRDSGNMREAGALASWHHAQEAGMDATDESLMQRIRSRDETALAILYHRHAEMVYFAVRPILTDEPAAREIIPLIFYRIWLKASDFNPASGSVLELLKTTARQYAFDRFLSRGFENGGLLSTAHNDPAFDVELMTRVSKTTLDLRPSQGALKEIDNSEDATWDQDDSRAEKLVGALKTKIRAALKALRELPLEAFRPGE